MNNSSNPPNISDTLSFPALPSTASPRRAVAESEEIEASGAKKPDKPAAAHHPGPAKSAAPKHFFADDEFDEDGDGGRNLDESRARRHEDGDGRDFYELRAQQQPPRAMSYRQPAYGRDAHDSAAPPFYYHQGYQGGAHHPNDDAGGHPGGPSGASVPSSYDASYPDAAAGPGGGFGYASAPVAPLPGNNCGYYSGYNGGYNNGYYDPYAFQQQQQYPPNQYGNAGTFGGSRFAGYPDASAPPPAPAVAMGRMGYASYGGGYDAENDGYGNAEGNGAPPSSRTGGGEEGFEPYPPTYAHDGGGYDRSDNADYQYE